MSRYPGATFRALPENSTEPAIRATQLIFHSAVSKSDTLFGYFGRGDVTVESHMYVQEDGDAEQYIDTGRQADANYRANIRAISIETWDNGNPDAVPWNDAQLARLADITVWAHREHGIPILRAPAWDAPGMGGHTDYPGIWTNVRGKTCPGLARRGQIPVILEMARRLLNGGASPVPPQPGPVPVSPSTPGVPAPRYPMGRCSQHGLLKVFGPKTGPDHYVSGYFSHRGDLRVWQERMRARGWDIGVDGLYGPNTADIARKFQAQKGLGVDGLVGPATWAAAWTSPIT